MKLIKYIGIIVLIILNSVLASAAVGITPLNPITTDNLYCNVNGASSGFVFRWTSSGFTGEKIGNPLSNTFTNYNDIVTCKAWMPMPGQDIYMGSASVTIQLNTPPNIAGRIPDYNIMQNSGLNDDMVPLWNFANDAETPVNQLIFTIRQQTAPGIVNCVIDDQSARVINPGVFIDCTPQLNQFGYSDISVRVSDGELWSEDIFRVNVLPTNNPPVISGLPDVTIIEDSGLNIQLIDLWNYASDVETSQEFLSYTILSESGLSIVDCSVNSNRYIECLPQLDQFGISNVNVQVQDPSGLTDTDVFTITVNSVNDAPVVSPIPDVTMYEDLPNSANPSIDLDNFVNDVDNPDSDMTWTFSGNVNLNIVVNPDNTITINPNANWFGVETVTFQACDLGPLCNSDNIIITVYPVNDIPVLSGIPDQTQLEDFGTVDNIIDLWLYASDIENSDDQLSFDIILETNPGIVDCAIDSSNRYIDCVSQADQNGFSDITVQVSDGLSTATDIFRFNVNAVNDAPVINPVIPNQYRDEDNLPWPLDLSLYENDAEDSDLNLDWSVSGVDTTLFTTSFDSNLNIITFTPIVNACGNDLITLTLTDSGGLSDTQDITVDLRCINDLPWINPVIPNQIQDEDAAPWLLDLSLYENDIEDSDLSLDWSVSGADPTLFTTSFDANLNIITFTPVANAFGSDVITLTLTDSDGGIVTQDITVILNPINDIPVINPIIPDQARDEGSLPWGVDLSLYENDIEDSGASLIWSVSGVDTSLFTVTIDPITHIATFILASSDVNGNDLITFTLTDSGGLSSSQDVNVVINPINDAPVVSDIPNTNFNEDSSITINLDSYVSDVDNPVSALTWTASGNSNVIVNIDPVTHIATLSAAADWNGAESITFTATDPGGLSDFDALVVNVLPVNDAPVVSPIPAVNLNEDTTTVLDLNNYVNDVDNLDSEITWSFSGNTNIGVTIAPGNIAVFTPIANWFGSESITFTARDLGGLTDSEIVVVNINAVNDAPIVSNIPNVNFNEDGSLTTTWSLNDYVSDIDNTDAEITWSFTGNTNVNVVINIGNTITFSVAPDWNGAEIITFRAVDLGGLFDEDTVTVVVNAVNDAPVLGDIPDVTIPEDGVDFSIDLDNYVIDVDNDPITWTYSGNSNVIVNIDPISRIVVLTPLPNWNGAETITFNGCDPSMLCDSDASVVTVTGVGDAPVVSNIPDINFNEDGTTTLDLNLYVNDPDNLDSEITWTTSGNTNVIISIVNGIATFSATPNWNGVETVTFTATDPTSLTDSDSSLVLVNAINDLPVINPVIPDQTQLEDSAPWILDLTSYATDVEDAQTSLGWSVSGVDITLFTTSFDANQRIITFSPIVNVCGSDLITLTVTDLQGGIDTQDITVSLSCINDNPVVSNIPNVAMDEDSTPVTLIQLDNFFSDIEDLPSAATWSYSPVPANIGINIDLVTHAVTFSILTPNWNGQETVVFRATDTGGLFAEDSVTVIVNPINDAPVINIFTPATPVSIDEGVSQLFSVTATDVDLDALTYSWELDGVVIPGEINPSYSYTAQNGPSTHTLEVFVNDGTVTVNQLWNINENNIAPQGVSANGPYYCAIGGTVGLSGSATDPGPGDVLTYLWDYDNDGLYDDANGQNPMFPCASGGIFNIGLQVSDGAASVTATTTVTVYNIVINEIMANPTTPEADKEWFELYNGGNFAVDINGWRISDLGTDSHTIVGSLIIPANDYIVLCRNIDLLLNGGVVCDYQYATFLLSNADDEIILTTSLGLEADRVVYDTSLTFPPAVDGASMELINPFVDNNVGSNWQTATLPYGAGDLGTPGVANTMSGNVAPVANAGPDQGILTGSIVNLDGSSSFDPNPGDIIIYSWSITITPVGSAATLSNPSIVNPTFTADLDGIYVIQLTVTDNGVPVLQDIDSVTVIASSIANNPPLITFIDVVPNPAGQDATLVCATTTSDPDSNPVTVSYVWSDSNPSVDLTGFTTSILDLSLVPNEANGDIITCTATPNDGIVNGASASDTATLSIPPVNNAPVANAGSDQAVTTGILVTLNGIGSFDPDSDPITYSWTQISGPPITLTGATTPSPTFTPAVPDSYVFQLIVNDGIVNSVADFVTIVATTTPPINNPPTVNAGIDQSVTLPVTVTLNGVGSDPDGDPITYSWTQISGPSVTLSNPAIANPTFTPIVQGSYVFMLTVTDTGSLSASDFVTISVSVVANNPPTATITSPASGSSFNEGSSVTFVGGATDPEDGTIPGGSLQWVSSINGILGTGTSLTTSTLGVGSHIITLIATDSGSLTDTETITVNINPVVLPSTIISSTIDGTFYASIVTNTIPGLDNSIITNSFITSSTITDSTIENAIIGGGSVITNCIIRNTMFTGICSNTVIDPSDIYQSTISGGGQIVDSHIYNSVINAGDVTGSTLDDTNIINADVTNSVLENVNVQGSIKSVITDSTLYNAVVIDAVITNNQLISGTVVYNTITYSAPYNLDLIFTNNPPTANAGVDQSVLTGSLVTLNGVGSDPDGGSVSYNWVQVSGIPLVSLSNSGSQNPTFTPTNTGVYIFQLVVNDGILNSLPDSVTITVSAPSPGGTSGGGGGGGGGGAGPSCAFNIYDITKITNIITREGCYSSFDIGDMRYILNIKKVTVNNLTAELKNNEGTILDSENVDLYKSGRLNLNNVNDVLIDYNELDFGKVNLTISMVGKEKILASTTVKEEPKQEIKVKETVKKTEDVTGAAVVEVKEFGNLTGIFIMLGVIVVFLVGYFLIVKVFKG